VEDVSANAGSVGGSAEDVGPQIIASRKGFFVWCDDADALLQEYRIAVCNILVARVVHQHNLSRRLDQIFAEFRQREGGLGGALKFRLPVVERLVVGVVDGFLGGAQPNE
jgi:hypothetical protein